MGRRDSVQESPKRATEAMGTRLPRTIWALGFVSLLMDVSSEAVHGLLPVFLVSVLGSSYSTVGFIEGLAEATALAVKVISGPLSDRLSRRKPFVLLGYAMGAVSKPFFAIGQSAFVVLSARVFDRIGKGIRGAPRDALIADVTPKELLGRAYGLRQSLDTVGAFIGPILAIVLMRLLSEDYRLVFWLAAIPGLIAVLIVIFGVSESESVPERQEAGGGARAKADPRGLISRAREFSPAFWSVAGIGAFLQLARFSEAFLILRATSLGLPERWAPMILIAMNIVYSLVAYPVGWLSDRMSRTLWVVIGFVLLAGADVVLALSTTPTSVFVGVALWGLHLGCTQGVLSALVAEAAPADARGTAFGVFNLLSALALLLASPIAGEVWDRFGASTTFIAGAVLTVIGLVALVLRGVRGPRPVA